MKIIAVFNNYRECLPSDAASVNSPYFMMKPDTALLRNNDPFYIPTFADDFRCGVELVVRFNRVAKSMSRRFAHRGYGEVGLSVGFFAADMAANALASNIYSDVPFSFDHSTALSTEFLPLSELGTIDNLNFEMSVDGNKIQSGSTANMIKGVDELIEYVSGFVTLKMGDLIVTGMPSPAVKVKAGEHITASLEGRTLLDFQIR